jgi:hypothetical protein
VALHLSYEGFSEQALSAKNAGVQIIQAYFR